MKIGPINIFERKVIGEDDNPLMYRYILFRSKALGIYLHHMMRSDYDRALHDHPWPFVSLVLRGGYFEHHDQTEDRSEISEWRGPGSVLVRPAEWRHRFELDYEWWTPEDKGPVIPSWTLVVVGRRAKPWGFFLADGWCWWRKHNDQLNICEDHIVHEGGSD
jgi:hypothetical protein